MARDINLGPTSGPYVNLQENSGDLDITGATNVDLNGATLTNVGITEGFDTIDVFEADGTFDASNVDKAFVECVGGGGGGGDADGTNTVGLGSGGGGGGYAASIVDLSSDNSISVTVGSGGSNTSAGGDSSFGSFITASGGGAGSTASNQDIFDGGVGGGGAGDVVVAAGNGDAGLGSDASYAEPFIVKSSKGGDSVYGRGGESQQVDSDLQQAINGKDATGYGGGGAGGTYAFNTTGGSTFTGGSGAQGVVIIHYKA